MSTPLMLVQGTDFWLAQSNHEIHETWVVVDPSTFRQELDQLVTAVGDEELMLMTSVPIQPPRFPPLTATHATHSPPVEPTPAPSASRPLAPHRRRGTTTSRCRPRARHPPAECHLEAEWGGTHRQDPSIDG